jgi:peptidylprolyl isomerase
MKFPDISTLKLTKNPSGLAWADVQVGAGKVVTRGSNADMHYTGWLEDGTKFDSSLDHGSTFEVEDVGDAGVIAGWNEGLVGMREGGCRVLVIPPALAYGKQGYPGAIPPSSTLVFMIEAVRVSGS